MTRERAYSRNLAGASVVVLFFLCTGILATTGPAAAWSFAGHRKIALIAYDRLPEAVRQRAAEILRRHKRFRQDFRMPSNIVSADAAVQDRWIFMTAGTWPDIVRDLTGEERLRYHHSHWHYINEPLFLSPDDEVALRSRDLTNLEKEPPPLDVCDDPASDRCDDLNVVQALGLAVAKLDQPSTPDAEKAIYLSWLLHLAADLHQPLHSTALFSAVLLPRGDQGGNLIKVGRKRLHAYWDDLPGTTARSLRRLDREVQGLFRRRGIERAALDSTSDLSFESWVEQSYELAWNHVYSESILDAVALYEEQAGRRLKYEERVPARRPPAAYRKEAQRVADRRVAEAGYRLAALIETLDL